MSRPASGTPEGGVSIAPRIVDPLANTSTPDPLLATEQLAAYAVAIATNILIIFATDMDDAQKAAILGLVNTLVVIGSLVHASYVRGSRARARGEANQSVQPGLQPALLSEGPPTATQVPATPEEQAPPPPSSSTRKR